MNFTEAKRLAKVFPDKYLLHVTIIPAQKDRKGVVLWALDYLADFAPRWVRVASNVGYMGYQYEVNPKGIGTHYFLPEPLPATVLTVNTRPPKSSIIF